MNTYEMKAQEILHMHTEAFMKGCHLDTNTIEKMSEESMYDSMTEECSFVLSQMLINGEITLREYFHVRDALGALLYKILSREYEEK